MSACSPHLSADAIRDRNGAVVAALAAGDTQATVAARHAISVRTVRRIATATPVERPRVPVFEDVDSIEPGRVIAEVITAQREALAGLRVMARAADNDSARVGAMRASAAVGAGLLDTLERCGYSVRFPVYLPQLRAVAGRFFDVADAHGVGEAVARDLERVLAPLETPIPLTTGGSTA